MKQFILIAHDATDADAYERRLAARTAHVASVDVLRAEGKILCGIAITDAQEKMIGSVMVLNFPSREQLDAWLETEPYVMQKVWGKVEILNGKIGPSFTDLIKKAA
tara:strand:+ start:188 stop:505 length:318 start_codon:yes stop_codon:yes gene_type:complete